MRRVAIGVILVALNWTAILAQQQDKPSSSATTPASSGVMAPDTFTFPVTRYRSTSDSTTGQSQVRGPIIGAAGRLPNPENPFVVVGGAVYIRLPADGFLVPVSGGGASGCFSVDLPRRIRILDEFVPRINALPRNEPPRP